MVTKVWLWLFLGISLTPAAGWGVTMDGAGGSRKEVGLVHDHRVG